MLGLSDGIHVQLKNWSFHVTQGAQALAFSAAPGQVFVADRLLSMLKRDDQLAFIMAHEMSHIIARHGGESISRNAYWLSVTKMLRDYVGVEPADNIVQLFLQLPYDRQQEHEADHIAMVLLSKV